MAMETEARSVGWEEEATAEPPVVTAAREAKAEAMAKVVG